MSLTPMTRHEIAQRIDNGCRFALERIAWGNRAQAHFWRGYVWGIAFEHDDEEMADGVTDELSDIFSKAHKWL